LPRGCGLRTRHVQFGPPKSWHFMLASRSKSTHCKGTGGQAPCETPRPKASLRSKAAITTRAETRFITAHSQNMSFSLPDRDMTSEIVISLYMSIPLPYHAPQLPTTRQTLSSPASFHLDFCIHQQPLQFLSPHSLHPMQSAHTPERFYNCFAPVDYPGAALPAGPLACICAPRRVRR
jgi:hypothetical protein